MSCWSFTLISTFDMMRDIAHNLAVDVAPEALQRTWKFFSDGGFFMLQDTDNFPFTSLKLCIKTFGYGGMQRKSG